MKRAKSGKPPQVRCECCGQLTPAYDIIHYASADGIFRPLCCPCLNAEVAQAEGLSEFKDARFEPMSLVDCAGESHEFHFRTHLFGPGVALDAFEIRDGCAAGYRFQVIGDPKDDLLALLGRLIEKMRRALSIRHIQRGDLGLEISDERVVRGLIAWDEAKDGQVPLVVVDGRPIAWEELGRMLMTFEGSQFKLEIRDKSEEV
jgi:hypothetical protein